jgi:hypothetical protein
MGYCWGKLFITRQHIFTSLKNSLKSILVNQNAAESMQILLGCCGSANRLSCGT